MALLESFLDATLVGYTKAGVAARGISIDERFPEVKGKHVVVTGATGGIGRAVTQRLAANGAVVHAVGRSSQKMSKLVEETIGSVVPYVTDLSLMADVALLADRIVESDVPLDGLVNNVGVMSADRTTTPEGFETTYALNLLGQFVLSAKLEPMLALSGRARVVNVSSGGMYSQPLTAKHIDSPLEPYDGTAAYARTKRGQVFLAKHWATEWAEAGISVNSMHPGWVDTEGVRNSLPAFRRLTRPLLRTAEQGADTIVWLVASDAAANVSGRFFHDRVQRKEHRMKRTMDTPQTQQAFLARLATDAKPYMSNISIPKGATDDQDR